MSNNPRTRQAQLNIIVSSVLKVFNMIIAFMLVPLTIKYISSEQYGIWTTISSIVAWMGYFDIGFGGGLKFRFAEAKANNDNATAKRYVSTTYVLLSVLFSIVGGLVLILNHFINWSTILQLSPTYTNVLRTTFGLMIVFSSIHIVVQTIMTVVEANQQPALSELIKTLGQLFSFIGIYVLSQTTHGNLIYLVVAFSMIPCIVTIISSVIIYFTKQYRVFRPAMSSIDFRLTKNILNMGMKYFAITSAMFFIFQFINIIITRELGAEKVTEYNVTYKYYNLLMMISIIILTPFWSAFTDAYVKKDFEWMRQTFSRLERIEILLIACGGLMFLVSPLFFKLWLGEKVSISTEISLFVCLQIIVQLLPQAYMFMINGTGKTRIQLIIYCIFAVIAIPSIIMLCRNFGIPGISMYVMILFITMTYLCRKQLKMIINDRNSGIWNK